MRGEYIIYESDRQSLTKRKLNINSLNEKRRKEKK